MPENKTKLTPVYLTEKESSVFIAMRQAKVFDMEDTDIIMHFNPDKVLTDIKKPIQKKINQFTFIYKRRKLLTDS
uniref:Uncharacterized protein n=1 Tax=viral metagenome TaxID=1070528 RepID=A0A6H1ZGD0_9ZZZZ